jgi:serine/threonine protein kinase
MLDKISYFNEYLSHLDLLDNYQIMSHIGKGCFSIVSLAIHKKSHKKYAIKVY